uniref:RNA helicase n=1 Tax=Chenopodium quinoa TaxID=63459 RepID=A0A803M6S3_CHEQI
MDKLPILQFEAKIVETVKNNLVTVLIGETGSGKSTQLSQILFRHGFADSGTICVTQPRRVAAVSVARRVAHEMGVRLGEEVGYAIRFEDRTSTKTRIKYLTDGVLLRESLSDSELRSYSVIILDEAHERSLNMDILMGLVKRLVGIRDSANFRVLITSATLEGEKVSEFFNGCPVLNVPGKLFPVEVIYTDEVTKSQEDIEKLVQKLEDRVRSLEEGSVMDAVFYPLHGSLPPELQVRVFNPPPSNCRRFIVATNIAETSLTVDGVVYVIDSGYVKQRQYNPQTGMYSLDIVQISRVQANQRAGRAGRTCPGKCYRLYSSIVYKDDFMEAAVPEIQRTSLAGSVLYLKSLDLPGIDILKFDFLDPPSYATLGDALRQLYLIDAIDENGAITSVGRTMAELPLEPSLSRTLIAANENGSLSQALTIAAMLSAETSLLPSFAKGSEKKRKHTPLKLPDGGGLGDHIQLLHIFELWNETGYDIEWCKEYGLQIRGMSFVKDVRGQLCQLMQKMAKCATEVQGKHQSRERKMNYRNLRRALCVGYANQLAERMIRHNGYRTLGLKSQLVQLHPSSVLQPDEDGMLPNYVVYQELITTSSPFMRNVCTVEMQWISPILKKLETLDINKLSGGFTDPEDGIKENDQGVSKKEVKEVESPADRDSKIQAARERFLARKVKK